MSEMVEKVARAMWGAREQTLPERIRQPFDERLTADIFIMARAAILAMREPSETMVDDAQEALGYEVEFIEGGGNFKFGTNDLRDAWQAMIDTALQEK